MRMREPGKPEYTDTKLNTTDLYRLLHSPAGEMQDIHNSIDDVIWAASFDPYQCLYINKASEKVFGYTAEEIMADPALFPGMILEEDRERFYNAVTEAFETGKSTVVFRIIHKNGSLRILKGQAILKQGEGGQKPILTGISTDITTLLNTRKRLKEKADELESILQSIDDAFFTIDKEANITYVNRALEEMLDIRSQDVLGRNAWELFPAAKDTKFYQGFTQSVQTNESARFEDYYAPLDKWFKIHVYPTAKGLSVLCEDITEERKAQQVIRTTKMNLRAIIDNTDDLIWSVDRDMKIIEANKAYKALVGQRYGCKALAGNDVFANIPEDKQIEWRGYFERALLGEPYTLIHHTQREDVEYWSRVRFNPIIDEDGYIHGVNCFSTDVTEHYKQCEALKNKNALLAEIANFQNHQVRGPIATILGLVHLIDLQAALDPHNKELLEGIVESSEKLDSIIREIDSSISKGQ